METKQYDWIILSSNLTLRLLWPKTPQPRRGGIARRKELKLNVDILKHIYVDIFILVLNHIHIGIPRPRRKERKYILMY